MMISPERTAGRTGPGVTGGAPAIVVFTGLATAVAGLVSGLVAVSVATTTLSQDVAIVIRGGLALVLVLVICRAFGARAKRAGLERPTELVTGGALLGFLFDPLTWVARTALTQVLVDPSVFTLAGDLVLWMAVAWAGARWGGAGESGPAQATTPYG